MPPSPFMPDHIPTFAQTCRDWHLQKILVHYTIAVQARLYNRDQAQLKF